MPDLKENNRPWWEWIDYSDELDLEEEPELPEGDSEYEEDEED
jgi:hypothetical protein